MLFTCWSEQRWGAGLVLCAALNGAEILYQRNLSPKLMHQMQGELLVDLFQPNPSPLVSWHWRETLEDRELITARVCLGQEHRSVESGTLKNSLGNANSQ